MVVSRLLYSTSCECLPNYTRAIQTNELYDSGASFRLYSLAYRAVDVFHRAVRQSESFMTRDTGGQPNVMAVF